MLNDDKIKVVLEGEYYENEESAIIAKDEANKAEKWAKYAEEQANDAENYAGQSQDILADVIENSRRTAENADRAEYWANNAEVQAQSLYQDAVVLDSPVIILHEKKCRYYRSVVAGDVFSIDKSALKQTDKDITFELILNMPTVVAFSFKPILPFGAGETADENKKWMNGSSPDLSEAGNHWFAFTSHDGGVTWLGSYEGRFLL